MSGKVQHWTPTPFDLRQGLPFPQEYADDAISQTSGTEAFETVINQRDDTCCVVCGMKRARIITTAHGYAHIIPQSEPSTWEDLRRRQFIPAEAKSVVHEARNGMLLCKNHRASFEGFDFYIRWVPECERFVFINISNVVSLQQYHGHAIRLFVGDSHVPFHGAFLIHEMRARGHWPFTDDPAIPLPIQWQQWICRTRHADDNSPILGRDDTVDQNMCESKRSHTNTTTKPPRPMKTITLSNPFANPAELEALKRSFAEQPNWKAAMVEGETWEGTAEENAKKYRDIMGTGN